MRESLEQLLGKPVHFPVEITLTNGNRHLLPDSQHAHQYPRTRDLVLYPAEKGGPFLVVVSLKQIRSIRRVRKAS